MTFAVGRISKCTLKLKLLVFLFCSPEVGLSYHVKCADRSAPSPNLRVSENCPIVLLETRVETLLKFYKFEDDQRRSEGPPHNYSSSFPAGVHAPVFRLSAKVNKVEGCAWLYAHQSPDRSHSQRISNRCEGFITFLSLSAERGCDHLSGEQVRRKSPVFVKRGCGANTR